MSVETISSGVKGCTRCKRVLGLECFDVSPRTQRPTPWCKTCRGTDVWTCTRCGESKPADAFPGPRERCDGGRPCLECRAGMGRERRGRQTTDAESECTKCRRMLPLASFRKNPQGRPGAWCDECREKRAERGVRPHRGARSRAPAITCSTCGTTKAAGEFGWQDAATGRRKTECKACSRRRISSWNKRNRARIRGGARVRNVTRRLRKRGVAGVVLTTKDIDAVLSKRGGACAYCGRADAVLTVDHVRPLALGGDDRAENLEPACGPCNSSKAARTFEEWSRMLARDGRLKGMRGAIFVAPKRELQMGLGL